MDTLSARSALTALAAGAGAEPAPAAGGLGPVPASPSARLVRRALSPAPLRVSLLLEL